MARKIYITESQLKTILEMAYPVGFSMDKLLSINSYSGRLKYCETYLKRIGQGSSRIVYAVDDEKVLKVAKNNKGIQQNQAESQGWLQDYYDCFAKVYDASDDGVYLEMQAARKAKKSDFKRLTGYGFDVFVAWIYYVHSWYSRSRYNSSWQYSNYLDLFKSEKFQEETENYNLFYYLQGYLTDTQLEAVGDLARISSWGVVTEDGEEKLVIIDFGLDDDIYDHYYRS